MQEKHNMFKKKRLYLDAAAGVSANASSPHAEGRAAREELEAARVRIARLVEAKPDDVLFTSGATEANALAILGTVCSRQKVVGRDTRLHAMYLPSAHASVVENMKLLAEEARPPWAFGRGVEIEPLPIKGCQVDCDALEEMLRPETVLVSMDAVCGETGVVWNTREVSQVLGKARGGKRFSGSLGHGPQSLRKPLPTTGPCLHVDASQAVWIEKLTRAHFGADLMTLDASKVCETRGIGCLIAPRGIPLVPLYRGGGQERGLVPGSEAPTLASAFVEGLVRAAEGREVFRAEAASARGALVAAIRAGISEVLVNEAPASAAQAPHILNISLPGRDTDYLIALLDEAGFATSTKSACETESGEGSRAVLVLFGDPIRAASTLRISWGPQVVGSDLQRFARALIDACVFIDSTKVK